MIPTLLTLSGDSIPDDRKFFFTYEQLSRMKDRQALELMGFAWAALIPLVPFLVETGKGVWYMIKKPVPRDTNPGLMLPGAGTTTGTTTGTAALTVNPLTLGALALAALWFIKR